MNRTQTEIAHFSKLKSIWPGQNTPAGQKRYDNKFLLFKKYCRPKRSYRILEIGCGDGEFSKRLAKSGAKIEAIDITPAVLMRAKKNSNFSNIKYKVGSCEKLDLKENSFDIVCGTSVLHHVNTKKTLKEAFRVLKKGGKVFFTEPNFLNPLVFASTKFEWLGRALDNSPAEKPLLRKKIERNLRNAGFTRISVKNFDFIFPWMPGYLINLSDKLGRFLEMTPILKETSGSLLIYGIKK